MLFPFLPDVQIWFVWGLAYLRQDSCVQLPRLCTVKRHQAQGTKSFLQVVHQEGALFSICQRLMEAPNRKRRRKLWGWKEENEWEHNTGWSWEALKTVKFSRFCSRKRRKATGKFWAGEWHNPIHIFSLKSLYSSGWGGSVTVKHGDIALPSSTLTSSSIILFGDFSPLPHIPSTFQNICVAPALLSIEKNAIISWT